MQSQMQSQLRFALVLRFNLLKIMVSRAGLEPIRRIDVSQVIDSTIRQKRQNRYFSRSEVYSGYTGY
jgi:hypothetical protein